ncbi:MAG: nucleotidyl transferase AbiEii/AbiGii toxin family protein [Oscillospiraceae bacterium]|nr:nucleotidyl transferase AbiEii/AbiGii toxin family protein [Oscillospiraceae bacterium]
MSEYDKNEIGKQAAELGFIRDTFEKMNRLIDILAFFERDPLLSQYLALKGGTAINLTVLSLPRLSVDIDLDFSINLPLNEMMRVRDDIRITIRQFLSMNGYICSEKSKEYHTLDSDVFHYINSGGVKDYIKVEINYSLRSHILPITKRVIETLGVFAPVTVLVLDPIEIFASKLCALCTRALARDLYDANNLIILLENEPISDLLRRCAVLYIAIGSEQTPQRFDFSKMETLTFQDIRMKLIPMLRKQERFDLASAKERVRNYLNKYLILTEEDKLFLSSFASGNYRPELLFSGEELARIINHPMALWKMQNFKRQ